jgi:hypothetical protein
MTLAPAPIAQSEHNAGSLANLRDGIALSEMHVVGRCVDDCLDRFVIITIPSFGPNLRAPRSS